MDWMDGTTGPEPELSSRAAGLARSLLRERQPGWAGLLPLAAHVRQCRRHCCRRRPVVRALRSSRDCHLTTRLLVAHVIAAPHSLPAGTVGRGAMTDGKFKLATTLYVIGVAGFSLGQQGRPLTTIRKTTNCVGLDARSHLQLPKENNAIDGILRSHPSSPYFLLLQGPLRAPRQVASP